MTTDNYTEVLFNDGEELTFQDQNNAQKFGLARLVEQMWERLLPGLNKDPQFNAQSVDSELHGGSSVSKDVSSLFCYALHAGSACARAGSANAKLKIAPGTLLQKIAASDGSEPSLLSFTFDGTTEVTFANGTGGNPRVDIVQMKLEYVEGTPTSRIFDTAPVKAFLNLATVTTHVDTIIRAKVPGRGGDSISIAFVKRTSGSGITYSENGNAITVLYEDAVSTVATFEAALSASTLIEIQSAGTPGNVLHDPADTFGTTHLASGVDQLLVSQVMNKTRRVQCTLSVKQGAAAASPTIPDPDAGYVMIFSMIVPTAYAWGGTWGYEDAGATPVIYDQRIPLGVRAHHVGPRDFWYDDAKWTLSTLKDYVTAAAAPTALYAPCREGGHCGRVVGIALLSDSFAGGILPKFMTYEVAAGGVPLSTPNLNILQTAPIGNSAGDVRNTLSYIGPTSTNSMEAFHTPAAGPTVLRNSNGQGAPIWTNGLRGPREVYRLDDLGGGDCHTGSLRRLITRFSGNTAGDKIALVTYYIAG